MGYGEKAESGAEMRLAVERGRRGAGLVSAEQFHQFHVPRDAGRHRSDLNLSYTCLNLDIDEGGPDLPEPEQGPGWATGSLRHAYSRPV